MTTAATKTVGATGSAQDRDIVASSIGGDVVAGDHGKTSIADVVIAKIAGIATREVDGVYDLGGGAARAVGKLRETIPGASANVTQGVSVEVGERQAAVDIGLVADYGVAIHQLSQAVRSNVIDAIEKMTGLEVAEVNVTVHDVHLDGDEIGSDGQSSPRVQ
jgi:uncharacterized alkaline shock family protein YloU